MNHAWFLQMIHSKSKGKLSMWIVPHKQMELPIFAVMQFLYFPLLRY